MGQLQDKCSCLTNENNCLKSNINFEFDKEDVSNNEYGETDQFKLKSTKSFTQLDISKSHNDLNKTERFSLKSYPSQRLSRINQIHTVQRTFRAFKFRKEFITEIKPKLIQLTSEIFSKLQKKFKNDKISQIENNLSPYHKDGWRKFYTNPSNETNLFFEYDYGFIFNNRLRIFENTAYYHGQLNIKGEMHGYGKYIENTGAIKEGYWRNNLFTGWGRLITPKSTMFEGLFIDGSLNGKGERSSLNSHYEGEFKDGLRDGNGTDKTKEYIYTGEFKCDKKHGIGKIKFLNTKESYEGDFLENCITGTGIYIWANKDSYQGTFLNGKMHGKGLYKWLDGGEYYGDYINGLKEGKGRFKWADGKIFEGPFKKGKPHGIGKLIETNNTINEVEFEAGRIVNISNQKLNPIKFSNSNNIVRNSPLILKKTFTSTTGNINDEENN